jgi:hypothetical protein
MFVVDQIESIFDKAEKIGFNKEDISHLLVAIVGAAARGFGEGMAKELTREKD